MIGIHLHKKLGLKDDISELLRNYPFLNAAQFFVSVPQTGKRCVSEQDLRDLGGLIKETGLATVVHGAYIDNPWRENWQYSLINIKRELDDIRKIGVDDHLLPGLVIHLGKKASQYIDRLLVHLSGYLIKLAPPKQEVTYQNATLWLEINSAKPGTDTFETPEKIAALFKLISPKYDVGLCVDSAHLFACGKALRTREDAKSWLDDLHRAFEEAGRMMPPLMFHFNDSASQLGAGKDVHSPIGAGNIWSNDNSGALYILEYAKKHKNIVIMERSKGDYEHDMEFLKMNLNG